MADWNEIIAQAQSKPRQFPAEDPSEFREAIQLFNRVYGKGPYYMPRKITKAEARRRVRERYPNFV
jgi:hypothetical protein